MKTAKFIEVKAEVRYWEDATVNGKEDPEGTIPLKVDDCWCPVIDLEAGKIQDWPEGTAADVYYKVCDQGEYWLLDADKKRVAKWRGDYVPDDILCVGDRGFGDYIILVVLADGTIDGWEKPEIDEEQWEVVPK